MSGNVVRGEVRDVHQRPIPGIKVALRPPWSDGAVGYSAQTKTLQDGTFALSVGDREVGDLRFSGRGWLGVEAARQMPPVGGYRQRLLRDVSFVDPTPILCVLEQGAAIAGRAKLADGTPAAGATILVEPFGEPQFNVEAWLIDADEGGYFALGALYPREYQVRALVAGTSLAEEYATCPRGIVVLPGEYDLVVSAWAPPERP